MRDQEEEVSNLLASLKNVEAPEGFEGGVRSRIARRRQDGPQSRSTIFLVAKFALPLVVLLVLGGFFIISDDGTVSVNMVPPILDHRQDLAAMEELDPDPGAVVETNREGVPLKQVSANRSEQSAVREPQGGSQDMGLSPDDSAVLPPGVDPRKTTMSNLASPPIGRILPDSFLAMIGISAACSSSGCSATDVRSGSVAANAGLRSGDLIVAMNGKAINATTVIEGRFTVSDLTIIRASDRIVVSLSRPPGR